MPPQAIVVDVKNIAAAVSDHLDKVSEGTRDIPQLH
jgi:hypothetical protein